MSNLKDNVKVGDYAFWYGKDFPFLSGGKIDKIVDNFKTSGFYRIDYFDGLNNNNFVYKFIEPDFILDNEKGLILLGKLKDLMNKRDIQIKSINNIFNDVIASIYSSGFYLPINNKDRLNLLSNLPKTQLTEYLIKKWKNRME